MLQSLVFVVGHAATGLFLLNRLSEKGASGRDNSTELEMVDEIANKMLMPLRIQQDLILVHQPL